MSKEIHITVIADTLEPGELEIRGDIPPLSWDKGIPLYDQDKDGIYQTTIELETGSYGVEFKFVKNGILELNGQPNREIRFEYEPEKLIYTATFNQPKDSLRRE